MKKVFAYIAVCFAVVCLYLGVFHGLIALGLGFSLKQRFPEAIKAYTAAISMNPFSEDVWKARNARAFAYCAVRRYDACRDEAEAVINHEPKNALAYGLRGESYLHLSQTDRALADYSAAIALDPKDAVALFYRARIYTAGGRYADALRDLDAALALRPNEPRFYMLRGALFARLGDTASAAADAERVRMLSGK